VRGSDTVIFLTHLTFFVVGLVVREIAHIPLSMLLVYTFIAAGVLFITLPIIAVLFYKKMF